METKMNWFKKSSMTYDDETIKVIETMPECDSILVIWDKMLCLAAKCESSRLMLKGCIPYDDEMLAALFGRPLKTVRLALGVFSRYGMVEVDEENVITICNWAKHQTVNGSATSNAERQKRWRDKHRNELREGDPTVQPQLDGTTGDSADAPVTRNALRVTERSVTRNVTRNALEKEIEEEKEEDAKASCRAGKPDGADADSSFVAEVVEILNSATGSSYKASCKSTRRHVLARRGEGYGIPDFRDVVGFKARQWGGDPKMRQYLRPETLFGAKFESYLQAARAAAPPGNARIAAEYGGDEQVWRGA